METLYGIAMVALVIEVCGGITAFTDGYSSGMGVFLVAFGLLFALTAIPFLILRSQSFRHH